ncbi:DUF2637 domain-containing protein (plasmid) [Streptomyces sp. R39]|uniref:DUF2637 domain-containing protein n=1 Tax=Streptomyces sp. R39 TaxID=3238631 RepID=A0AB39R2T4_9ACTN
MDEYGDRWDPYGSQFPQGIGYDAPSVPYCEWCDMSQTRYCQHTPEARMTGGGWDLDAELAHMLNMDTTMGPGCSPPSGQDPYRAPAAEQAAQPKYRSHAGSRRIKPTALLIAGIIVCTLVMLGWSISYSYEQLRAVAALFMSEEPARWWPWMLYGPWLAAGMSIMRASLQYRSARWSWTVIVTASVGSVALCMGNSSKSVLMMAVAGIPPLTALACFQELVGQFSYRYRPQHAMRNTKRGSARP